MSDREIRLEAALRKLLEKAPSVSVLDEVDDAERTGRRPCPVTYTIKDLKEAWAALGVHGRDVQ